MSILKVIYSVPLFFQISYLLLPNIEICLKYFLDKNSQKQPLWNVQPNIKVISCIFFWKMGQNWICFLDLATFTQPASLYCPMALKQHGLSTG